MIYLADINFWLALTFESHNHHAIAKEWFDRMSSPEACAFCRLTQQGFLRLATNPKAFGDEAVTLAEAWRMYDALRTDPRVHFLDEPSEIEHPWREFTSTRRFSPKVWNDAYLAAFAHESESGLITFDQGFSQYSGLACTILS